MFVRVKRAFVTVVLPLLGAGACSGGAAEPDAGLRWLPRTVLGTGTPTDVRPPGDAVPFRDRNANGRYDAYVDPVGYCAPDGACRIPPDRLTVHRLRRNGIAGSSAGVLLSAQRGTTESIDGRETLDLPLCTDQGACSQPMQPPFDGLPEIHALWLCAEDPTSLDVAGVSVAGASPVAIPSHPHVRLVAGPRGAGSFDVRSSESIDRILVRLVQLDAGNVSRVTWTSDGSEHAIRLDGPGAAHVTVPDDAAAACPDCAIMIQVVHVWRDDELRDVSEAWLTLPLGGGDA